MSHWSWAVVATQLAMTAPVSRAPRGLNGDVYFWVRVNETVDESTEIEYTFGSVTTEFMVENVKDGETEGVVRYAGGGGSGIGTDVGVSRSPNRSREMSRACRRISCSPVPTPSPRRPVRS